MNQEKSIFVAIDEWVHSDLFELIWNESVAHFAQIGELQQLILQRPLDGGPLLLEATASKGSISLKQLPRHNPGLRISEMWLTGETAGDNRERVVMFPWNPPISHFLLGGHRMEQSSLERVHFERFTSDVLVATGTVPYDGRIRKGDRPDILVESDQGHIGIDCCQFIDEEAKTLSMLFNLLKNQIIHEDAGLFTALHGASIVLLLGDNRGPVKPPKRSDVGQVAKEIVNELSGFAPKFVSLDPGQSLPEKIKIDIRTSPSGLRYFANPGIMTASDFQARMGFDITFDYSISRTVAEGWTLVRKLIADHDSKGFDHLLISVGAPDKDGSISPNEAIWFSEMLRFPEPIDRPAHLMKVYFHNWASGQVHEISWVETPSAMIEEWHGPVRHD